LWQQVTEGGTTKTTIWIGGIYEIKDDKTLCHVFADGRRVATFEPVSPFCAWLQNTPGIREVYAFAKTATTWPLQEGRAPLTACLFPLVGILAASIWGRRRLGHRWPQMGTECFVADAAAKQAARRYRRYIRVNLWQQAVSVLLIVALFVAVTPTQVNAQTFDPVFYYYHGDHLGSSNILTDRQGNLVQHYEYTAFGKERFVDNSQAFSISHRYTGQIFDEATGLYYYNARYYDPELAWFVQADTIVPSGGDPQTLNRYSYVRNNPLKYTDPSGHVIGIDDIIIGIIIGAAIGGATSAATGGNIWQGILTGAIGGLFGGLGAWAGQTFLASTFGETLGQFVGAVAGGAAGGAVSAAAVGGNVGIGALTGAFAAGIGLGVGWMNEEIFDGVLSDFSVAVIGSSLGSGVGTELQGGDFWEGAKYGAIGAGVAHGVYSLIRAPWANLREEIRRKAGSDLASAANDGLEIQINDFKYGHASFMNAAQRVLGLLAAPIIAAYGVGYEVFHVFFPGHTDYKSLYESLKVNRGEFRFKGFFDGQHPANWLWDTPGDMLANVVGQFSGVFLSRSAAAQFNRAVFLIPGPNYTGGFQTWERLGSPGAAWPW
jgi:RHS repeat-associated protein